MKYGPQRNWRHIASNKTMPMPIKDSRPRVNAKPYRPTICTVQLKSQIFGRPSTQAAPCDAARTVGIYTGPDPFGFYELQAALH